MSQDFDNELTGTLFRNDKGDNPKRSDYKGSATIKGVEYWASAWVKKAEKGKRAGEQFLSIRYEAKEAKPNTPPAATPDGEDKLPF